MRAVFASAELRAAPGSFVAGESWLHFHAAAGLWGVLLWGRPTSHDVARLVRSLSVELDPLVEAHGSLVDARRVDGAEPGAFAALSEYVAQERGGLARKVKQLALVRPEGMAGAIVAGFFEVLPKPYPVRTFVGPEQALAWLATEGALGIEPGQVAHELAEAMATVRGTSPVLARVRAVLASRLREEPTLADVAAWLATSERTLQRRLFEADTTLSEEIARAKVAAAKLKMTETDEPLTSIALDVGCASLQHFGQLFRRFERVSPSAWRKAHRP